jgi:multiple antibiotic resistance protein
MNLQLSYAFTIFFVTLGPIKTIPGFVAIAADLDQATSRRLAIRSTLIATVIVFATAIIFIGTLRNWQVSLPAMELAGGILLFSGASAAISKGFTLPPEKAADAPEPPELSDRELNSIVKRRSLSPLAIPTIVTPVGIVAILVFVDIAKEDSSMSMGIYGLLALIMFLNLVGMWFGRLIVRFVGFPNFQVIGWIFSVLQAGLGIQVAISALRLLGLVPPIR